MALSAGMFLVGQYQSFPPRPVWATLGRAKDRCTLCEGSAKFDPTLSIHAERKKANSQRICASRTRLAPSNRVGVIGGGSEPELERSLSLLRSRFLLSPMLTKYGV